VNYSNKYKIPNVSKEKEVYLKNTVSVFNTDMSIKKKSPLKITK